MTDPERAEAVTGFEPEQLAGFRIGVTSDRRSNDLTPIFGAPSGTGGDLVKG